MKSTRSNNTPFSLNENKHTVTFTLLENFNQLLNQHYSMSLPSLQSLAFN